MPFKINIHTNINDYELTIEKCNEIIQVLQTAYDNMRQEMYNHFLGKHSLKKALFFSAISLFCFFITKSSLLLYCVPISAILTLLASIISAEYMTSQSRKQLYQQIQHYIQKKENLVRRQ